MQEIALAGNRIVRAIRILQHVAPDAHEAVRLLREAQGFVAAELRKAQPTYEAAVAAQVEADRWGDSDPY